MSIKFIYGRAGAGKSTYCLNNIKKDLDFYKDKKIFYLVPDDYSFIAEKALLDRVLECGLLRARVISFRRLINIVQNEAGGICIEHMNNAGKVMIIYRILERLEGEFLLYKKAVKMPGFVSLVSQIISEFKLYNITPDILLEAYQKTQNEALKIKIKDLYNIYSNFEESLHQKYIDAEDELVILSQNIDRVNLFNDCILYIDGFAMFTPVQYDILSKLIKKSSKTIITLNCDFSSKNKTIEKEDLFSGALSIEKNIIDIAMIKNIPIEEYVDLNKGIPYRYRNNKEIAHIEKNLFSYPVNIYEEEVWNISLLRAINRYSEVEEAARDIIRLCREKNYRYRDIAVITGDVDGYEKLIAVIFNQYKIPYFFDKKRDILKNPLIVLLVSAIEIITKKWTYEAVFKYLKTGLLNIDIEDIDLIENYVLAYGIRGKKWTSDEPWSYGIEYDQNNEVPEEIQNKYKKINEIRNCIREPILELDKRLKEACNTKDLCTCIYDFLCSINIPDRIESIIKSLKEDKELMLADEYSKVFNILIEALDQMVRVMGEEKLTLDKFLKVLTIGFNEYKISLIPSSIDEIIFTSVDKIKGHTYRALYIIGVNDGIFPNGKYDEGVLNDSDRDDLRKIGIKLAPDSRDKVFDEQYTEYVVLTRAYEYLRISYAMANHEGKSLRPSRIITKLKKMFKNIKEYDNVIFEDTEEKNIEKVSRPIPTYNSMVEKYRILADSGFINPVWKYVFLYYKNKQEWKERLNILKEGLYYKNSVNNISGDRIWDLYGKNPTLSISRLEKYASCPFSYFIEYGLKAKERKLYELSAPDIGTFIHKTLDNFFSFVDKNKIDIKSLKREECQDIVYKLAEEEVEKASDSIFKSSVRYSFLKERMKRTIFRAVWLAVFHLKSGGFNVEGHEISFENGGTYPPIELMLPSGYKVDLIGRIDRMDTFEDSENVYVRIIDYKTGNKAFNISDIYNGLELQLLIYLDAILEQNQKSGNKKYIPGGILYFRVDDPMVQGRLDMTDEEIEKEINKKLKMRGLIINNVKVVKEMDKNIKGYSIIIPVYLGSDGISEGNSSLANEKQFEALRKHVKRTIIKLCEDMLRGNIEINPYKKNQNMSCKFCSFSSICRFDITIKDNTYRIINDKDKSLILKELDAIGIEK